MRSGHNVTKKYHIVFTFTSFFHTTTMLWWWGRHDLLLPVMGLYLLVLSGTLQVRLPHWLPSLTHIRGWQWNKLRGANFCHLIPFTVKGGAKNGRSCKNKWFQVHALYSLYLHNADFLRWRIHWLSNKIGSHDLQTFDTLFNTKNTIYNWFIYPSRNIIVAFKCMWNLGVHRLTILWGESKHDNQVIQFFSVLDNQYDLDFEPQCLNFQSWNIHSYSFCTSSPSCPTHQQPRRLPLSPGRRWECPIEILQTKHTAAYTMGRLEDWGFNVLSWCPNSPNMNSIKNLWDHLDPMVCSWDPLPWNLNKLWEALNEEWENIDWGYIDSLYTSLPNPVRELLKANGGETCY